MYASYLRCARAVPPNTLSLAEAHAGLRALRGRPPSLAVVEALVQVARARIAIGQPGAAVAPLRRAVLVLHARQEAGKSKHWRSWWLQLGWLHAQVLATAHDGMDLSMPTERLSRQQKGLFMRPFHILRRFLAASMILHRVRAVMKEEDLKDFDPTSSMTNMEQSIIHHFTADLPHPKAARTLIRVLRTALRTLSGQKPPGDAGAPAARTDAPAPAAEE